MPERPVWPAAASCRGRRGTLFMFAWWGLVLAMVPFAARGAGTTPVCAGVCSDASPAVAGQGGAGVARSGGLDFAAANPAAIAAAVQHEGTVGYVYDDDGRQGTAGALWYAGRLRLALLAGQDEADAVRQRTPADPSGNALHDVRTQQVALTGALPLTERFACGLTGRYLRLTTDGTRQDGWSGDAGLLMLVDAGRDWYAGFAVRQAGPQLKHDTGTVELPTEVAVGTSLFVWPDRLRLNVEAVKPRHEETGFRMGIEVLPLPWLALRGGWRIGESEGRALTGGIGFAFPYLAVDYAATCRAHADDRHAVSLTVAWGGAAAEEVPAPAPVPVPARQPAAPVVAPAPAAPAAESPPPEIDRLLREGEAFTRAGQFWHAAERCRAVLALDPHNYLAYYQLGHAAYQVAQYDAADTAFMCALVLNPNSVEAMVNLGAAAFQLGEYESAALLWEKALALDPQCEVARRNREELRRMGY